MPQFICVASPKYVLMAIPYSKALRVAIESMERECRRYVVDANLRRFGLDSPGSRNAAKRLTLLAQAIEFLEELLTDATQD